MERDLLGAAIFMSKMTTEFNGVALTLSPHCSIPPSGSDVCFCSLWLPWLDAVEAVVFLCVVFFFAVPPLAFFFGGSVSGTKDSLLALEARVVLVLVGGAAWSSS